MNSGCISVRPVIVAARLSMSALKSDNVAAEIQLFTLFTPDVSGLSEYPHCNCATINGGNNKSTKYTRECFLQVNVPDSFKLGTQIISILLYRMNSLDAVDHQRRPLENQFAVPAASIQ